MQKSFGENECEALPFPPEESASVIGDEALIAVLSRYTASAVDIRLVKLKDTQNGPEAHRAALCAACRALNFAEDAPEEGWSFEIGKARARQVGAAKLFAQIPESGPLTFPRAFLSPPNGMRYTDRDFDALTCALFPDGTGSLEVYEWTTDWSDYFDEGHEWWGTLCLTVYDGALDRFAVILASATD